MSWAVVYTKHARKDAQKLAASGLKAKAQELLAIIKENPFQNPPPYEKLVGDLSGAYSRRINIQHRLVYEVLPEQRTVKVLLGAPFLSGAGHVCFRQSSSTQEPQSAFTPEHFACVSLACKCERCQCKPSPQRQL